MYLFLCLMNSNQPKINGMVINTVYQILNKFLNYKLRKKEVSETLKKYTQKLEIY